MPDRWPPRGETAATPSLTQPPPLEGGHCDPHMVFGQRAFPPDSLPRVEAHSPLFCFKGTVLLKAPEPLRRRGQVAHNVLSQGATMGTRCPAKALAACSRKEPPPAPAGGLVLAPPAPSDSHPGALTTSRSGTKSAPGVKRSFLPRPQHLQKGLQASPTTHSPALVTEPLGTRAAALVQASNFGGNPGSFWYSLSLK